MSNHADFYLGEMWTGIVLVADVASPNAVRRQPFLL